MARRRGLRAARPGARVKYLGIGLVHGWRWTFGLLTPRGTCKYHPTCSQYALDALREFGLVRGTVLTRLAAAPLQPVESRRRRLRARPDALSAAPLAEGPDVIVGGLLSPIENVLTDVLTWLHDTGGLTWAWSIVALTVMVRMLLVPLAIRQIHSMQSLQMHAPEMKAIQQRYKADRQRQSEELMKFYRENKINPYASCLPIVFQIPIFISLFFVLKDFEKEIFAAVRRIARLARARRHHRADEGRVGARAPRRLRAQPAHVDVAHVDADAVDGAAGHDHGAPDRLHPVHPQLPVGAHDLLADHEPLDDGAGHRHPPADAEADRSAETIQSNAAEGTGPRRRGDARRRPRRPRAARRGAVLRAA